MAGAKAAIGAERKRPGARMESLGPLVVRTPYGDTYTLPMSMLATLLAAHRRVAEDLGPDMAGGLFRRE